MQMRPVIFVFSAVLLVPFIYAVSYIPNVCAAPADPKWEYGTCEFIGDQVERLTCCWSEPDIMNPGKFIVWCQTCDLDKTNCGPISMKQSTGPMGVPPGSVLEDPNTLPKLGQDVLPNGGGVLEQPENNMTFSRSNVPFAQANDGDDNSNNTFPLFQSDIQNDTMEDKTTAEDAGKEQDESDTTEEDDNE